MRLLYVIDSLAGGGAETSLAEMTPGLIDAGIDLHVASLSATRLQLKTRLEDGGAKVHVPRGSAGRLHNVRSLSRLARHLQPDAIHTTLFEADVAGRITARLVGVPSSTSLVNDSYGPSHFAESPRLKLRAAQALDASTAVLARRFHSITEAIAVSVAPRLGMPLRKIDVIPRGRDPLKFPFRSEAARLRVRHELGIPAETPIILAVGRQEPQKGLQHLLAAVSGVATEHPDLVVLIAGREGRSTASLKSIAAGTGLDIRFLGHRSDVADLLAAADVFCFPSEREGFGGALIEAMAVGCPIVSSDIPTSLEVLGSQVDPVGDITPVGDVPALTSALRNVLDHPDLAMARADRGRVRFEQMYTNDAVVKQMAQFFESVAQPRS